MPSERWLCPACGATSDPAPVPPPGCSRCDAPLHVGKFGLLAEMESERSARVFRGRESDGRKEVTVRLFPESMLPSLPQIRNAVKRAAALVHPMIATPLDAGTHRNLVYVVETASPGLPILKVDLTLREGMSVMRNVALALDHVHGRGLVHPDLRAENVRLSRGSGRSLGDFGWQVTLNCFGIAAGGCVRDNVCALGNILYAVAAGRAPAGSQWPPTPPSSINPLVDSNLESIILMAMEPDATHQPPSMEEIAAELGRWLEGDPRSRTKPKSAVVPPPPKSFRIPPRALWAAGLGLTMLAAILFFWFRIRSLHAPSASEPVDTAQVKPSPQARMPEPPPTTDKSVTLEFTSKSAPPPELPPVVKVEPLPEPVKPTPAPPPPEPSKPVPPKPEPPPPPKPEPPKPEPPKPEPVKPEPAPPPPPKPEPRKPEPPAPPPEPAAGLAVGDVQAVHPDYGVFVKLESTGKVAENDALEALRNGQVVARLTVVKITPPEKRRYPQGCAVCQIVSGKTIPGDKIRKIGK